MAGKKRPEQPSAEPTLQKPAPRLACRFYRNDAGTEPVREWLLTLDAEVRKEIGSDIKKVQWRWPVSKPIVDGFGDGLYEVRTACDGNIYRVLFCIVGSTMVLLHGLMKKSRSTPQQDKELARRRQREVEGAA